MSDSLKLITAMGNADLVLELVDFFNGGDRFHYNDEASSTRSSFSGMLLTDLYLVCTINAQKAYVNELLPRMSIEYPDINLHPIYLPFEDISSKNDDETMRSVVYDQVRALAADNLVISSGGRKTLTNRIIEAGLLYGCMGYLTITAPYSKEKSRDIRSFTEDFNILWISARRFAEERRNNTIKGELGDNFRSLYLLPTTMLKRLMEDKIGANPTTINQELEWLRKLPKADLHCHLGGAFDAFLLKTMASSLLHDLQVNDIRQQNILKGIEKNVGSQLSELTPDRLLLLSDKQSRPEVTTHCLQNLEMLFMGIEAPHHMRVAVLLDNLSIAQIEALCWHEPMNLLQKDRLKWYMCCGDLGGSALLQTERNLRLALRWLMEEAAKENTCLLEVRFSPLNYTLVGCNVDQVVNSLLDEAAEFMTHHESFQVNFLVMGTRHKKMSDMEKHVRATIKHGQPSEGKGPRITGFDLAGQEEGNDPANYQETILPLHHAFMNITIHAGEMAEDDKIWQAIYALHARRIGHGLKLINNKKMMGYVRDYSIGIEMCPSSNRQTNRFRRHDIDEDGPSYPLKQYLEAGLMVTVNTDNRGISRTSLSKEYLKASQMTPDGLSRWEILRLMKNSFKTAFLPKDQKDKLLKMVDERIFSIILDDFFPENN